MRFSRCSRKAVKCCREVLGLRHERQHMCSWNAGGEPAQLEWASDCNNQHPQNSRHWPCSLLALHRGYCAACLLISPPLSPRVLADSVFVHWIANYCIPPTRKASQMVLGKGTRNLACEGQFRLYIMWEKLRIGVCKSSFIGFAFPSSSQITPHFSPSLLPLSPLPSLGIFPLPLISLRTLLEVCSKQSGASKIGWC